MTHAKDSSPSSLPPFFRRLRLLPMILVALLAACSGPGELPDGAVDPADPPGELAQGLPSFGDYPATRTFDGDPAPVDLDSHPEARTFRTALTRDAEAGAQEARFAGHYRVVVIGCGTSCKSVWAVNLLDGSVHNLFTASYGVAFRPDSRLIVANDPTAYEQLLDEMPAAELRQLIATYGPPRFWIERDGAFEPIGPRAVRLDPESGKLVAGSPEQMAASWRCTNDLEVLCAAGACGAETGDAFTPMSVTVERSGALSVCAYSGCWEGTGEVVESGPFLILSAQGLRFSTAGDPRFGQADVAIVIDSADGIATLKAGEFAHPLLCEPTG